MPNEAHTADDSFYAFTIYHLGSLKRVFSVLPFNSHPCRFVFSCVPCFNNVNWNIAIMFPPIYCRVIEITFFSGVIGFSRITLAADPPVLIPERVHQGYGSPKSSGMLLKIKIPKTIIISLDWGSTCRYF